MEIPRDAVLLRVFVGEPDRTGGRTLHRAIVEAAFKAKLAGATVFHGPLSYGHGDRVNDEFNVDAPGNLPAVVEIIDLEEKIEAFLPQLDSMIGSGLVTLEKVQMMRVGRRTIAATGNPPHLAERKL
jgi:PII-like signaling protein